MIKNAMIIGFCIIGLAIQGQQPIIDTIEIDLSALHGRNKAIDCISEYIRNCSLLDDTIGQINDKSLLRFEQLFMHNANVVDDISKNAPAITINYRDYTSIAYTYLNNSGIIACFSDWPPLFDDDTAPSYRLMELNNVLVYRYEIPIMKSVYIEIDTAGHIFNLEWGKVFPLLFVIYYFPETSETFISDILPGPSRRQFGRKRR